MPEPYRILTLSAGLSVPSSTRMLADQLGKATLESFSTKHKKNVFVENVELRDIAQDVTNKMLTGFPSEALQNVLEKVNQADGIIAVTPIFSASYSGLFKMFFDILDKDDLKGKPVLLGATAGTARHSLALEYAIRPLFHYLKAEIVALSVFAASEDWGGNHAGQLNERVTRAGVQFARLIEDKPAPKNVDPFALQVDFATLLQK